MKRTIKNILAEYAKTKNQIYKLKGEIKKSKQNIIDAIDAFGRKNASAFIAEEEDKIRATEKKIAGLKKKKKGLKMLYKKQLAEIEEMVLKQLEAEEAKELEQPKDKGEQNEWTQNANILTKKTKRK